MSIMLLVFVSLLMGLIQISIFISLWSSIKRILASVIIVAVACNAMLSAAIAMLTGVGAISGIGNLAGSVIFGVYLEIYRRKRGIGKPRLAWVVYRKQVRFRLLWLIPVQISLPVFACPVLRIPESHPNQTSWLWR